MIAAPTRPIPWRLYDVLVVYAATALGFGLLVVAYWGASSTAEMSRQLPWVNVAIVGIMVLGTGNAVWLLNGRRAVGERRRRLVADPEMGDGEHPGAVTSVVTDRPVAAAGMRHYHRPDCQLVAGKSVRATTLAQHRRARRQPCGMCQP